MRVREGGSCYLVEGLHLGDVQHGVIPGRGVDLCQLLVGRKDGVPGHGAVVGLSVGVQRDGEPGHQQRPLLRP